MYNFRELSNPYIPQVIFDVSGHETRTQFAPECDSNQSCPLFK